MKDSKGRTSQSGPSHKYRQFSLRYLNTHREAASHTHRHESCQNIYTQKENPPWPAQNWRVCSQLLRDMQGLHVLHITDWCPWLGPLMLRKVISLNDSCCSFSLSVYSSTLGTLVFWFLPKLHRWMKQTWLLKQSKKQSNTVHHPESNHPQ